MDYQKIYNDLVAKCVVRGLDKKVLEGYYEKHHIIPKCLGGTDKKENFVLFTPREHVIAHRLLWKANPENYSLMWAYTRTVNSHKGLLTSREVEKAKIAKAEFMSNRVVSDETKEKIRQTLTGHKRTQESIEKGRQKTIGQTRSDETKAKLKQARKDLLDSGWTMPEEARKRLVMRFVVRKFLKTIRERFQSSIKVRLFQIMSRQQLLHIRSLYVLGKRAQPLPALQGQKCGNKQLIITMFGWKMINPCHGLSQP